MADDQQSSADYVSEPYFEPIGPRSGEWFQPEDDDDDGGGGRRGSWLRAEVLAAVAGWGAGLRTFRFWAVAAGAVCAAWAVVAALVFLPGTAGDPVDWLPAPVLTYLLAGALLPAAAALTATHWGMAAHSTAAAGVEAGRGILAAVLLTTLKGLVLAVLILLGLLLQAGHAGQPGTLAAVSAGVSAVEGLLFGAIGVAVAGLGRRAVRKKIAGWVVALFLVVGSVAAASFLVPAVRSEEPVTVALNVARAPSGTPIAYECSNIPAATSEVYRTERITWLAAASPSVVFVMLAGPSSAGDAFLGWLSSALQEAADGTGVPCVNGEPRSPDTPSVPLAAVGLVLQAGIAAVLLTAAHGVAVRRRDQF